MTHKYADNIVISKLKQAFEIIALDQNMMNDDEVHNDSDRNHPFSGEFQILLLQIIKLRHAESLDMLSVN